MHFFQRKTLRSKINIVLDRVKHAYDLVVDSTRVVLCRLRLHRMSSTPPSAPRSTAATSTADNSSTTKASALNSIALDSALGQMDSSHPTSIAPSFVFSAVDSLADPEVKTENSTTTDSDRPSRKALIISCSYGDVADTSLSTEPANPEGTRLFDQCTPRGVPTSRGLPLWGLDKDDDTQDEPMGSPILRSPQGGILMHAHKDGKNFKRLLEEKFDFKPEEIEWLADFDDEANGIPSKDEIKKAIGRLCEDAKDGDIRVFIFIGHGDQTPNDDGTERDGLDELIIIDGGHILDDELKRLLVKPLLHCKLTAILDCCHSGTMLDLRYSSEDGDQASTLRTVSNPPSRSNTDPKKDSECESGNSPQVLQPRVLRLGHTVYSISACSDPQRAWEFKNGYSLTDLIVQTIRNDKDFKDTNQIPLLKLFHKISAKFDRIAEIVQARSTQSTVDDSEKYTKQDPQLGTEKKPNSLLDNATFIL